MKKASAFIAAAAMVLFCGTAGTAPAAESTTKNPYQGNQKIVKEGRKIFDENCKVCHGEGGKGDICPNLTLKKKKFGDTDADLFMTVSKGRPGGMPNWDARLGTEKIWKVITYIRSIEK
ncbi:MAG: c-type cytochrome [Nitrospiraceae bacterium]|nr:c-type cytochrome [Nitrospiraceae bacterium]